MTITKFKYALILLLSCLVGYFLWLYLTHFYYRRPSYAIGVKNDTLEMVKNVRVSFEPKGEIVFGDIRPGGGYFYENPQWPKPEKISINFNSATGGNQAISVGGKFLNGFEGRMMISITRQSDLFTVTTKTNTLE